MSTNRTQEQILARVRELLPSDLFGFDTQDLLPELDFDHVKEFLKPGTTEEQWNAARSATSSYRQVIEEYLPFAQGKADDKRSISAARSVSHFRPWLWLAGEDAVLAEFDAAPYTPYGKPKLKVVRKYLAASS